MKYLLLLLLAGCCSTKDPEIYATGENGIDFYDPHTDTIYQFRQEPGEPWKLTGKIEHWSRPR